MPETGKIRIIIADDFKVLRDVIRLHLARAGDMDVVGEAPDLDDALERVRAVRADVVIMNDYLPPIESAHATARFREQGFTGAILVISIHLEPGLMQRSFLNGANGFMHKDEIDEYLVDAIRRVHQGERYVSPKAGDAYSSIQE
ncbi:MAG TPA: response regulator transcription factor [Anaerolineales bacterium]|nr:response regulator transcription factor [Anaerolineales bacterium]